MVNKALWGAAIALAIVAQPAFSDSPQSANYVVYGIGSDSCGEWTDNWAGDHPNTSAKYQEGQWLLGYVSGLSLFVRDMRQTDSSGMVHWVTNYCRQHPTDALAIAGAKLVGHLRGK